MPHFIGTSYPVDIRLGPNAVSKVYVGPTQVWPVGSVIGSGFSYLSNVSKYNTAIPYIAFYPDGSTLKSNVPGTGSIAATPWSTPILPGSGDNHWVIVIPTTSTGGTDTGEARNVRLQLSTMRSYSMSTTAEGQVERNYTVQFWNAATGGTLLSSGTMKLSGEGFI